MRNTHWTIDTIELEMEDGATTVTLFDTATSTTVKVTFTLGRSDFAGEPPVLRRTIKRIAAQRLADLNARLDQLGLV